MPTWSACCYFNLIDERSANFAKELGEFYVGQGQLEPNVIDKFETNVVDTFVKGYK